MIRGLLVYTLLAVFCVGYWAATVLLAIAYGWAAGAVMVAVLVAVYEVVFGERAWDEGDERVTA